MVLPMLWMLATSFKPPAEIALWPPRLLAAGADARQFHRRIFEAAPFGRFFVNSVGLSRGLHADRRSPPRSWPARCSPSTASPAARLPVRRSIIATAIVPFESYMIPLYLQLDAGRLDQHRTRASCCRTCSWRSASS